ncbi:hypothetical protein [Vibrio mediterranei]|uniref:hypothetical protein n=1 Tax=Vibrio mediterranei TaxID=689 RepID=UPI004069152B
MDNFDIHWAVSGTKVRPVLVVGEKQDSYIVVPGTSQVRHHFKDTFTISPNEINGLKKVTQFNLRNVKLIGKSSELLKDPETGKEMPKIGKLGESDILGFMDVLGKIRF